MTDLVEIEIVDLPIELQARASAHTDALQREFELIALQDATDTGLVPRRLRELVADLNQRFGGLNEPADAAIARAREEGRSEVTVTYRVPPAAGEAARQLIDLLAEADDYCRSGELITLATPADQVAFREWFLGEFIRQIAGQAPRSWRTASSAPPGSGEAPDRLAGPTVGAAPAVAPDPEPGPGPDDEGWGMIRDGGSVRVAFAGELDLDSAPHLRSLVAQAAQQPMSALAIDLSEVTFMDSVGLSVLLAVRLRLADEGVEVTVTTSPAVDRVFRIAGVTELFAA